MPWPAPARAPKRLPYLLVAFSMSVVVSCATVASPPSSAAPSDAVTTAAPLAMSVPSAGAVAVHTALPTTAPTPSSSLRPRVVSDSSPAASVAVPPVAVPSPTMSPLPASSVEPAGPGLDDKTVARLQRVIDNQVANKGVPGLQVAVRLPGGETWVGTAGQAELDPGRPVGQDTQFAIASVTKTFTAALILQLVDEGKIDLDATFGSYFRDAPRKDKVTIRQLLSHTSGIHNYWNSKRYATVSRAWWEDPAADGLKSRAHRWTYDEMIDMVKSGEFKPGADYEYSNTNFLILGRVAEAVEGKSLARQLRERFFEPLGLVGTVYQPEQKPRPDAAHGHWAWPGGYTDHTRDSVYVPFMAAASIADAAGAIASTARDLAVWAGALYGGDVLSEEMLAQMTTFLKPGWYGLGTDVAVFAGHVGHGHRGGIRGYDSSMWYFPDSGVSVVLLSNLGNWVTDKPMEKMVKVVLGQA